MPNGNVLAGPAYSKPAKTSFAAKLAYIPFVIFITLITTSIFLWGPIAFQKPSRKTT